MLIAHTVSRYRIALIQSDSFASSPELVEFEAAVLLFNAGRDIGIHAIDLSNLEDRPLVFSRKVALRNGRFIAIPE